MSIVCHTLTKRLILKYRSCTRKMATLETLVFDNKALKELPIDPEAENYPRSVAGACFSKVSPTPVESPKVVAYSKDAMKLLDLDEAELKNPEFAEYFSGNKILPGSETAAHCYCGHQFGYFSGQLGDGAAMYLGEVLNKNGERWEIQLKGAGLTPYSRQADGRKVLRSSVREFLCSEAMHFLGVPTTRAGSCVTSDSRVVRDIFYDGRPIREQCSIVLRIAPTFLRFGSFEICRTLDPFTGRAGPSVGRHEILFTMLNYAISTFYPEVDKTYSDNQIEKYKAFYKEVVLRTARMVAFWQCVGFCHGVLNTDNMSIMGLTIDYGPFGFMDRYDPDHICNASDDGGRYTFIRQPEICRWNLKKFAQAIEKAVPLDETMPILDLYFPEFERCYREKMRKKMGLFKEIEGDKDLFEAFFSTMASTGADFTNSFRCLHILQFPKMPSHDGSFKLAKEKLLSQCCTRDELAQSYENDLDTRKYQLFMMLMGSNPALLEQLGKGPSDLERIQAKMQKAKSVMAMTTEVKQESDSALWDVWLKQYSKRLEKEYSESATTEELEKLQKERENIMKRNNPVVVLRNYIAQVAISLAEKGDFSEVNRVLKLLENPYDEDIDHTLSDLGAHSASASSQTTDDSSGPGLSCAPEERSYNQRPPQWAKELRVT